jgi:hypothetical protein
MSADEEVLLPAEAARRLGVKTRVVVQAMYERRIPRVRLDDGTLGIPAGALAAFRAETA